MDDSYLVATSIDNDQVNFQSTLDDCLVPCPPIPFVHNARVRVSLDSFHQLHTNHTDHTAHTRSDGSDISQVRSLSSESFFALN